MRPKFVSHEKLKRVHFACFWFSAPKKTIKKLVTFRQLASKLLKSTVNPLFASYGAMRITLVDLMPVSQKPTYSYTKMHAKKTLYTNVNKKSENFIIICLLDAQRTNLNLRWISPFYSIQLYMDVLRVYIRNHSVCIMYVFRRFFFLFVLLFSFPSRCLLSFFCSLHCCWCVHDSTVRSTQYTRQ